MTERGVEFRTHWRALLGCTIAASIGTIGLHAYTSGAFMPALVADAHYTRDQLSLATLILSTVVALTAPIAGAAMDRYGALKIISYAVIGEAMIFGALSIAPANFSIYAGLLVLLAFVGVGTTPPGFARIISLRFDRARGLALGCMVGGLGLMAITGPIWATWIIGHYGWRVCYAMMAGLVLMLGGGGLLLIRTDRSDATSQYDVQTIPSGHENAFRRPLFWMVVLGFLLPSLFGGGYLLHLISILRERGFSPASAARVQSLIGVAVLCGRLFSGAALDRFSPRWVAAVAFLISAAGCALLLSSSTPLIATAALAIGLTIGAELDIMAYFISRYFSIADFGRLYGFAYGMLIFGGGLSPVMITRLAALGGGYTTAMIVSTIGVAAGALVLLLLPDPRLAPIASRGC